MKRLIFFMCLALCSLITNAQQLEPNYHYSFWSNWNIGVGGVYSKPFDLDNWCLDNGANVGVDVRLEKPLSKVWTVRLDACIPGLIENEHYDRYGTAMAGANLNLGRWFYLFADGGIAVAKFGILQDNNYHFAADAGLGSHIWFSDNAKLYLEVGTDCVSKIERENTMPFGKLGFMYCLGITNRDKENIAWLHEMENGVPRSEYDRLVAEKNACTSALEQSIQELNNMRNCCQKNYEKYEKEITELKEALEDAKKHNVMPFSVLFDKNSVNLSSTAKEIIAQIANEMCRENGKYTLYGFGDYTGSEDYNQVLSVSRCESVKAELVRNGVPEESISVVGFGKSQYFGSPESYINRRVMFVKD